MASVALINPPLQKFGVVTPHLGLAVIANSLRNMGHQVVWLDLDLEKNLNNHKSIEASLNHLKVWLNKHQPDIIGCTAMFNNSLFAERVFKTCRTTLPSSILVAGGPHFGVLAERAMERNEVIDFIITGEAEVAFPNLVNLLEKGKSTSHLDNLVFRNKNLKSSIGKPKLNSNADGPLIDLIKSDQGNMWNNIADIIDLKRYTETFSSSQKSKFIYIEAGRGCPFKCNFCATAPFWKYKYRVKSVDAIVSEMKWLHQEYEFDHFILVHDLLTVRRDFMSQLCDAIFQLRLPITWMANSRVDLNHEGLLPKLQAAGCTKLFFGIESGSREVQTYTTKNLDPNKVGPFISELSEQGITSTCSFVFGFPDETTKELSRTIDLAARVKLSGAETVQFHRLRLWPPAKIVESVDAARFDKASLKLEWPFSNVDDGTISQIEADKKFFSGYFSLESPCGDQYQLAQVETFFVAAMATVPMTIALLCRILGDSLIETFNELLNQEFTVELPSEEPESELLSSYWLRIEILCMEMIKLAKSKKGKYTVLITPILQYEIERLKFVENDNIPSEGTKNGSFKISRVKLAGLDLNQIFDDLKTGNEITKYKPDGMTEIYFRRNNTGTLETFILEEN